MKFLLQQVAILMWSKYFIPLFLVILQACSPNKETTSLNDNSSLKRSSISNTGNSAENQIDLKVNSASFLLSKRQNQNGESLILDIQRDGSYLSKYEKIDIQNNFKITPCTEIDLDTNPSPIYGSDLRDLRRVVPTDLTRKTLAFNEKHNFLCQAEAISNALENAQPHYGMPKYYDSEKNTERFLKLRTKPLRGPWLEEDSRQNTVYGVEILDYKYNKKTQVWAVITSLLYHHGDDINNPFKIQKIGFSIQGDQILSVANFPKRNLSELNFTGQVSIYDRQTVFQDSEFGFKKVYPVGVGGLNEGVYIPHWSNPSRQHSDFLDIETIEKLNYNWDKTLRSKTDDDKLTLETQLFIPKTAHRVIKSRSNPRAYASPNGGHPFLGIYKNYSDKNSAYTSVAFHFRIEDQNLTPDGETHYVDQNGRIVSSFNQNNGFKRGFVSHGCMRMRDREIYELLALLENSSNGIPISVYTQKDFGVEHPYPRLEHKFKRDKIYGNFTAQDLTYPPYTLRDIALGGENWTKMEWRNEQIPDLDSFGQEVPYTPREGKMAAKEVRFRIKNTLRLPGMTHVLFNDLNAKGVSSEEQAVQLAETLSQYSEFPTKSDGTAEKISVGLRLKYFPNDTYPENNNSRGLTHHVIQEHFNLHIGYLVDKEQAGELDRFIDQFNSENPWQNLDSGFTYINIPDYRNTDDDTENDVIREVGRFYFHEGINSFYEFIVQFPFISRVKTKHLNYASYLRSSETE